MDSDFNLITPEISKHLSKLNGKNGYGFTRQMILTLITKHERARKNNDVLTMQKIEYRLTDGNFHHEVGFLSEGKYEQLRKEWEHENGYRFY